MQLPPIQDAIISRLKNAAALRYRDLNVTQTANDLFNYHLKSLVAKGIVDKTSAGYTLSQKGQAYVADIRHTSDPAQRLFKINVITIVSRIQDGHLQILTQRRNSQPSHGLVDVMGGTIVKGEDLLEGAARKLNDETGLTASFRLLGFEKRRLYKDGELFSDVLFPICYADNYAGTLTSTEYGENFWVDIDTAITNTTRPYDSIAAIRTCLIALRDTTLDAMPLFYTETTQQNNDL